MCKILKIFGFLYFVANIIICFAMAMFATTAWMSGKFSPGYMIIVVPLTGIFSGYWMRESRYGLWRILVIGSSIIVTTAILFTAILISPELEKTKQKKFESNRILEQNTSENQTGD